MQFLYEILSFLVTYAFAFVCLQVYSPSPDEFVQDSPRYTSPKPGPAMYGDSYYSSIGKNSFLAIVVWIGDTFDNNFGFTNDFTKYLKDSCW